MHFKQPPSLADLPAPPEGKTGWPWNIETKKLPSVQNNGKEWPKISIITPSYNQGQYIEETIRSILLQGYPNLEFIIIDGGSNDDTIDVINKYKPWITFWKSEKDSGQSEAINKGFRIATGKYVNWINSDDLLAEGALEAVGSVASIYTENTIIAGNVLNFNSHTGETHLVKNKGITLSRVIRFWDRRCVWHQPGLFLPKDAVSGDYFLDESLHYVMDYDLLCRLLLFSSVTYLDVPVAMFRLHGDSKGVSQPEKTTEEHIITARKYWQYTGFAIWKNEMDMKAWLLIVIGSSLKHRNYNAFRKALKYLL